MLYVRGRDAQLFRLRELELTSADDGRAMILSQRNTIHTNMYVFRNRYVKHYYVNHTRSGCTAASIILDV